MKFLNEAQELLSQVANNYDVDLLWLAVGACSIVFIAINSVLLTSIVRTLSAVSFIAILEISYGLMMFASSFVEEEQQYWQWIGTAWFTWLSFS